MAQPELLSWQCGAHSFSCGARTVVAGILNVTPDSFSDGGRFFDSDKAMDHARKMAEAGADIIDVGGESSRPGSERVSVEEELRRVLPTLEAVSCFSVDIPISIDTTKAEVARRAIERGAEIVNDITALRGDPEMAGVVAESGAGVILMHMAGTPETMQKDPRYDDVVGEIEGFFEGRIDAARAAGIRDEQICLDPGVGFGKTLEHNLAAIAACRRLRRLGFPVMIGASRKSFIDKIVPASVDERLEGSLAAAVGAALNGADVLRVHDVAETRRVCAVADALRPHCVGPDEE